MLAPNKMKYRKRQRCRVKGKATRGSTIAFGDIAIKALEHGKLTSQQIEAARVAIMRHIKRGGKIWIRIFPDIPYTKKPAEVRMGSGKGAPEGWVAPIRPGRVLYEVKGVDMALAKEALNLARYKLPIKTTIVVKEGVE